MLAYAGAPAALSWLTTRLTGTAEAHGCTKSTVPSMLLTPTGLTGTARLVLADALALLDQPIGGF